MHLRVAESKDPVLKKSIEICVIPLEGYESSVSKLVKPNKFSYLQVLIQNLAAKSHVKPKKRLTQYLSTTSALRGSYSRFATIEIEEKKVPVKSPGLFTLTL